MKKQKKLTQNRLKELFNYDPATGLFTRLKTVGNIANIGDTAGTLDFYGYIVIKIDGKSYKRSRLAWLYVYGYFPEIYMDHINRNRTDDRLCNIRHASSQCNARNAKTKNNNTSGVTGVHFRKDTDEWVARININYRRLSLGKYKQFHNAVLARLTAEFCLNWSSCNSNSSAYQYAVKHNLIKKQETP